MHKFPPRRTSLEICEKWPDGYNLVSQLLENTETTKLRTIAKRAVQGLSLVFALPLGLLCCFGRIPVTYTFFAQMLALVPGIPGNFWRAAFYKLTLYDCSIDMVIGFGSFFSRPQVSIAPHVSIGSYCIIGPAKIGSRTQISSHVEIPGARQHVRDAQGLLSDSSKAPNTYVTIGADCWIGASSIIMADVGAQSTIGAGSVVVKEHPCPCNCSRCAGQGRQDLSRHTQRWAGGVTRLISIRCANPVPILLMVRELGSGGIERDVTKLAISLDRSRFTPYVATYQPNGVRHDELKRAEVPVIHLQISSFKSPKLISTAVEFGRFIRKQRIGIVHAFDSTAVFGVPLARFLRVPVVLASTLGHRALLDRKTRKQFQFTDRLVDAIVVNCNAMRDHLIKDFSIKSDHIELCYNGVDTREFHPVAVAKPNRANAKLVIQTVCV